VEMDPEMVERAREYLAVCGEGNCVVIEDDARRLAAHVPEPVAFALIANTFQ
jgi:predicted RNA methylase